MNNKRNNKLEILRSLDDKFVGRWGENEALVQYRKRHEAVRKVALEQLIAYARSEFTHWTNKWLEKDQEPLLADGESIDDIPLKVVEKFLEGIRGGKEKWGSQKDLIELLKLFITSEIRDLIKKQRRHPTTEVTDGGATAATNEGPRIAQKPEHDRVKWSLLAQSLRNIREAHIGTLVARVKLSLLKEDPIVERVLDLCHQGETLPEIALHVGRTLGEVKTLKQKVRRRLKWLQQEYPNGKEKRGS